jgi:arylsulfatase A-like enzyme
LITADDLGYSDLGAFGGEIDTPNLDALAARGIRLTGFYAAANCSPTRAMLMSGVDSHLAGIGAIAKTPNQQGKPGYEGYLNDRVHSLAKLMRDTGYATSMTGKWHLGFTPERRPPARGFERSFAQHEGASGSHFDLTPGPAVVADFVYTEDGEPVRELPDGFYSSDAFTDKIIEYIDADRNSARPFFAFLSFTAPHWPLQAPAAYLDKYRGRYDAGYEQLRETRLASMKALGLMPADVELATPPATLSPWEALTDPERRVQARYMETYAAMVDNMDVNVGRVIDYLKTSGHYENTLIIFLSDNGAAGLTNNQKFMQGWIDQFDNSFDNLGRNGSMVTYGPGWALAGATPFRLFKRYNSEGGIRVPAILGGRLVKHGDVINHEMFTVMDLAPTMLAIAGADYPEKNESGYVVPPLAGRSLMPLLTDPRTGIHDDNYAVGWELNGHRAVRRGDSKLLWLSPPYGHSRWELFDIAVDPGEQNDLSASEPGRLAALQLLWQDYVQRTGVVLPDGPVFAPVDEPLEK